MKENIVRFNVRMPSGIARVFETFAALLGYKKSTFIFVCAIDGLMQKVGRESYFDMVVSQCGDTATGAVRRCGTDADRLGSVNGGAPAADAP